MDLAELPTEVRYVKNGEKGKWWDAAKSRNQVHLGWRHIPAELFVNFSKNKSKIEKINRKDFEQKSNGKQTFAGAVTNDFNQLVAVMESPSKYVWITFEENRLWWCTVKDGAIPNPNPASESEGHFWLECDTPWRCTSLNEAPLVQEELSGTIKKTAGFRGTVCTPGDQDGILRKIKGIESQTVINSKKARQSYEDALLSAIQALHEYDFENLVDLIFQRSGWSRTSRRGKTMKDFDIFLENPVTNGRAYVQIKSVGKKKEFEHCIDSFKVQSSEQEMLFFVAHTPQESGEIGSEEEGLIHIWSGRKIAKLAVSTGLGSWIESKLT